MTLIVSVITNEGIVLAADDLATEMHPGGEQPIVGNIQCPHCLAQHSIPHTTIVLPSVYRTRGRAVKIIPFFERLGLGFSGGSRIFGKPLNWLIPLTEGTLTNQGMSGSEGVLQVGSALASELQKLLQREQNDATRQPSLTFQIVGYDNYDPVVCTFQVGLDVQHTVVRDQNECIISGDTAHVKAIWSTVHSPPFDLSPQYDDFSIYDAQEYAQFTIRTAAAFQEFSKHPPTIGSRIRIGIVVPYKDFEWITP